MTNKSPFVIKRKQALSKQDRSEIFEKVVSNVGVKMKVTF